jgi:hypothetical protein
MSFEVYPGDTYCNRKSPHALWHELSANGLMDLVLLMNEIRKALTGQKLSTDRNNKWYTCFMSNKCYRGFDFTKIHNPVNDSVFEIMQHCLPYIIEPYPNVNAHLFLNCALETMRNSSQTQISKNVPKSVSTDNRTVFVERYIHDLESCVHINECIHFSSGFDLNVTKLKNCVSDQRLCLSYINDHSKTLSCLNKCLDGATSCAGECLYWDGTLSPVVSTALSCFKAYFDRSNERYGDYLNACTVLSTARRRTWSTEDIFGAVVAGLPDAVNCSLQSCRVQSDEMVALASNLNTCSADCLKQNTNNDPFPFIKLPVGIACVAACYFSRL